jgi:7-cyano-7-deazaguanine synthase
MKQDQVVLLLSGGMDSTTLAYVLSDEYKSENVHVLNFYYKQKHAIEVEKAKLTASKLGLHYHEVDISFLGDMIKSVSSLASDSDIETPEIKEVLGNPQPSTYVPNRNMILASIAASYAEAVEANSVYISVQAQDLYSYWDTTSTFIKRINEVLLLNRQTAIQVKAPFADKSKKEIIEIGLTLDVPYEDTLTCYNPNEHGESCGKCASCAERLKGFAELQIKDPIPYSIDINWEELFSKFNK